MKVCVVGTGYVGLVAGVGFAELGHQVICVDRDESKVCQLNQGGVPIHEEHLAELLQRHRGVRLSFSSDLEHAVRQSTVVFIAVGTPQEEEGDADLSYVEAVARAIAACCNGYKLIVEKSTGPVRASEFIERVLLRHGAMPGSFEVASNPEFLREGTAVRDFLIPDRVVIGVNSLRAATLLGEIYGPLTSGEYYGRAAALFAGECRRPQLIVTSTKSAELIKHASNAFLAMKISFINAVANVCEAVGADVAEVSLGMGSDRRIGQQFLKAGLGYGGSCFPKDLKAFRGMARELGCEVRLLDDVISINDGQLRLFLKKVRSALCTLEGKRVAVLGIAFKGGTDDVRESPAVAVIEQLLREGCDVAAYDPAATVRREALGGEGNFRVASDPYSAATGGDALLILTDWPEFSHLDLKRMKDCLRYPVVIDGRNLLDPSEMKARGFHYTCMGRMPVTPELAATPADVNQVYPRDPAEPVDSFNQAQLIA